MAEIDKLFKLVLERNASDLHLSSGAPPYFRIYGSMVQSELPPLKSTDVHALIFEILQEKQKKKFLEEWELDYSYSLKGVGRFRCNLFMQRRGLGAVCRLIPSTLSSVEDLNLPPQITELIHNKNGLILVTGPTSSGKSTTLAALLNEINRTRKEHILTIEDPIEFIHPNLYALVNQREVNSHTKSFSNALRSSLREDPDVILLGEMRDLETMSLAMTAAETGHLVLGTLHTSNAAKTIDRIIDVFPEQQQAQTRTMLAESLRGVVAQTLFKDLKQPGRVAAFEVLKNTTAVGNLIRENKTFQIASTMQTGSRHGMITFENNLLELISQGSISKEQAEEFLGEPLKKLNQKTEANQYQSSNTTQKMSSFQSIKKDPSTLPKMSGSMSEKNSPSPLKKDFSIISKKKASGSG